MKGRDLLWMVAVLTGWALHRFTDGSWGGLGAVIIIVCAIRTIVSIINDRHRSRTEGEP